MNIKFQNNIKVPKKVLTVHDMSCLGRCALTVVIPLLSQMGVQAIPLPTAILSTHTGGYTDFSFLSLTQEMEKIYTHITSLDTKFDSVYSGFLADESQIEFVMEIAEKEKKKNGALFFADPVMGDDGVKYQTYTDKMCALTKELAKRADVITPNTTEACILLGEPYREKFTKAEIRDMLDALSNGGKTSVVITGVHIDNKIGASYLDTKRCAYGNHYTKKIPTSYPGTGEAFSSVLLGSLLRGKELSESVFSAVSYVFSAVSYTNDMKTPIREGILLEALEISGV